MAWSFSISVATSYTLPLFLVSIPWVKALARLSPNGYILFFFFARFALVLLLKSRKGMSKADRFFTNPKLNAEFILYIMYYNFKDILVKKEGLYFQLNSW